LKDSRGKGTAVGQFTIWPGGGAPHWINDKNSTAINSKTTQQAQQALEPYLPKAVFGPPLFDEATREKALSLRADITKYYNEATAKFIIGDLSFDKWSEYVTTMQKLGLKDLEAIYQKSFETMNK
jgi:putative aldouronate transport system substrate-binding protein